MSRHRKNPAWVQQAMEASAGAMSERLARPKTRKGCKPEKVKTRSCYIELGTGGFGTVLATDDPNTVVKLTTDKSEAQFAAVTIVHDLRFPGVVRYDYAVRLPVDLSVEDWEEEGWMKNPNGMSLGLYRALPISPMEKKSTHAVPKGKGFPLYALWRRRAKKVGEGQGLSLWDPEHVESEMQSRPASFKKYAREPMPGSLAPTGEWSYMPVKPLPKQPIISLRGAILPPFWAKLSGLASEVEGDVSRDAEWYEFKDLATPPAERLVAEFFPKKAKWNEALVGKVVGVADAIRDQRKHLHRAGGDRRAMADALEKYLDRGILIGSVEGRNTGAIGRTQTLIDPDKVIFLGARYNGANRYLEQGVGGAPEPEQERARPIRRRKQNPESRADRLRRMMRG